jgi:hypothetical protein
VPGRGLRNVAWAASVITPRGKPRWFTLSDEGLIRPPRRLVGAPVGGAF